MSFWEEFGQRITQESQKALRKTRDLASVVTINADISDSKRKINDLYQELGQLVVNEAFAGVTADRLQSALSDEDADETAREIRLTNWQEIYAKVMFIRSEEEVIALNESKINELKSESRCPDCGKIVSKGMSFCPECGRKLEQPEAAPAVPVETAAPAEPAEAEAPAAPTEAATPVVPVEAKAEAEASKAPAEENTASPAEAADAPAAD